ncbi:MAG: cellulose biosynthesis protein BcsS [Pseudomonadota bacterium]
MLSLPSFLRSLTLASATLLTTFAAEATDRFRYGDAKFGSAYAPSWIVGYGGIDFAKDAYYYYGGFDMAVRGDVRRSGMMLRGTIGFSDYDYASNAVAGSSVEGDFREISGSVGWKITRQYSSMSFYAGADYRNHSQDPEDSNAAVSGGKFGGVFSADYRFDNGRAYLTLEGLYATAFNSYRGTIRGGYTIESVTFGPEVALIGDDAFNAQRFGGFMLLRYKPDPKVQSGLLLSAGYQFVDDPDTNIQSYAGHEGAYLTANVAWPF